MGRDGGSDGVSGDLFIPQTMAWGETQCTPGGLTEAVQGVRKGSFLPLLAGGEAVSPAVHKAPDRIIDKAHIRAR
jgi:hypothetical protein